MPRRKGAADGRREKQMNRYNVYDNGVEVGTWLKPSEASLLTGVPIHNICDYASNEWTYAGRYTIRIGNGDEEFMQNWDAAVALFKRVMWVKIGGRKLHVSKRRQCGRKIID